MEIQRRQQEQQRQLDQQYSVPSPGGPTAPRGSAPPGAGGSSAPAQPTRSVWLDRPALPPARNPLLGRWAQQSPGAAKGNSPFNALLGSGLAGDATAGMVSENYAIAR